MDFLDTYYQLNPTQQRKINLPRSMEAGYLIDIRGNTYKGELKSALMMSTHEAYKIFKANLKQTEPPTEVEDVE